MDAIVFKGHFETNDSDKFIEKLQEILKETDTSFFGRVEAFEAPVYTDYEEVTEKEEVTQVSNDEGSTSTETQTSN